MKCRHPFALLKSFSDPRQLVKNKNNEDIPYGLFRYEELVKECYILSKNINTPYTELMDITLKEKNLMLDWLSEEAKRKQEEIDKYKHK